MSRETDEHIEKVVADFIDKNFWDKSNLNYKRVSDKKLQYQGCDLSAGQMIVDEKVKFRGVLNTFLEYPSFEIISNNKYGNQQDGWFIKKNNITNTYMFISLGCSLSGNSDIIYSKIEEENIRDLSVLIVSKKDMIDLVQNTGLTLEEIKNDAEILIMDNTQERPRHRYEHKKFWLTYSSNLREQPVNLVIPKSTLLKLKNTRQIKITREGVKRI